MVIQIRSLVLLYLFLFSSFSFAENLHERDLGIENSTYLKKQISEFFYDGNSLSPSKLDKFREENEINRKEEIKLMVDNFINEEGLSTERANKKALKDKKVVALNWILSRLETLDKTNGLVQREVILKNILRVYFSIKRQARDSVIFGGLKSLGSIMFKGHGVPLNPLKRKRPSNLANNSENRYYTKKELNRLIRRGEDISKINPANTSLWKEPSDVASENPLTKSEMDGNVPTEFKFKKIYTREGHPKMRVNEILPNGKKKSWKLKFGREVNVEIFVSRFMNLLGYNTDEYYYGRDVKVYFKNKEHWEKVLLDWIGYYNNGMDVKPGRYVKETGEDTKGFFVLFHESLLETKPETVYRTGDFHVNEMGNWERREVRALLLLQAFFGNHDFKPSRNNRVKLFKEGDDFGDWKIEEIVHDLGFGFGGQFIQNAPNDFKWSFMKKGLTKLKIKYKNNQFINKKKNPFQQATISDIKWLARYLVQVSRKQLETMAEYAGWPRPVRKLFVEKMVVRRNEIVKSLDFEGKILNGRVIELWPEVDPKKFSWGKWIKEGKLLKEYREDGYPIDYLKIDYEPEQLVYLGKELIGPVFKALDNIPYYKMISFPQENLGFTVSEVIPGVGVGFRLNREIKAIRGATDEMKAWITTDTLQVFGNAGVLAHLPVTQTVRGVLEFQALMGKQFKVSYFSPTPLKAIIGRPKLLAKLAFMKKEIVENLEPGTFYSDGLFVGLETTQGIETTDLFGAGAEIEQRLIFLNRTKIQKGTDGEMLVSKIKSKSFKFTFAAYLKLINILKLNFFEASKEWGTSTEKTYHFNLDSKSSFEHKRAFHLAAYTNKKDKVLDEIPVSTSELKYYEKKWMLGALATIGGTTRGDFLIKKGPDGEIKRSFSYLTFLNRKNMITGNDTKYKVLGYQEFRDDEFTDLSKQKLSMEFEVLDETTNFKEMEKRVKYVNDMVGDKRFFQYTPSFHGKNHLGQTYMNLRFDLKESAVNCIFDKIKCLAKGPKAYKIGKKFNRIRKIKNPIRRLEKLGPWLRNRMLKPANFKDVVKFIGGENTKLDLWIEGDTLNRDRFIHLKADSLNI